MPTIDIDGQAYTVEDGTNLLQACLSAGLDLPYFCWHPSLGSVGACRQCALIQYADADDQNGRLVVGCMTPVAAGMRVSLNHAEAIRFRAEIIELLMTNHPHDCPVCEEGGQCHLQDMTVMTGHTGRRYRGKKRTHTNQYLGPFVRHEMNRCIACYRCVRFYQDYAGGRDLGVFASHNHVYFGRSCDGVLENEFSGNLVEVCPTGVFTDKTSRGAYSRKWDLQTAPSVCVHCSVGCNITPGERYGELRSIVNRYHGAVNGYFLCDRGRFGYGFVNSPRRLRTVLKNGKDAGTESVALEQCRALIAENPKIAGIGSPNASVEANYALRRLVGENRFYGGVDDAGFELASTIRQHLQLTPGIIPSMPQIEDSDAILILGEDISNTAPRIALAVRQAVRNRGLEYAGSLGIPRWQDAAVRQAAQQMRSPLFLASCGSTRLDDVASRCIHGLSADLARFGFAVAGMISESAPRVEEHGESWWEVAREVAAVLKQAERPLIISGAACNDKALPDAAANIVKALDNPAARIALMNSECNALGLSMMEPESPQKLIADVESGHIDTLIVLENDLFASGPRRPVEALVEKVKNLILIDHTGNELVADANWVFPAAAFAESEGTLVNFEGRAQRYFQVFVPATPVRASWEWLRDLGAGNWSRLDDLIADCASEVAVFDRFCEVAPAADFRVDGLKVPRQHHRYSGRTAMRADVAVSEARQPVDADSALAFSMEGMLGGVPPALRGSVWSPSWNSAQAINRFQEEIGGPLSGGDPGIRLVESDGNAGWSFGIPAPTAVAGDVWTPVPQYYVFGSERLSALAPAVAERIEDPVFTLNPGDAERLKIEAGSIVELQFESGRPDIRGVVCVDPGMPPGAIGLPHGLEQTRGIDWRDPVRLRG